MKNWMKHLSDNTKISEINLPGTHNSCTKRVQFSYFSKCHDLSIYEQLNIGVRFLDIRVEKHYDKLKTVHSIADCYTPHGKKQKLLIDYVLEDCKKFLRENPSESIILCIKRDDGTSSEEAFDLFFNNYLKNDPDWFTENRIPRLGEVRGKLVFFNRFHVDSDNKEYTDQNTGLHLSAWPDLPKDADCFLSKVSALNLDNTEAETCYLQDMYKLFPKDKWHKAVLPLVEKPVEKDGLLLNYFSAANFIHSPRIYAKYILKNFENISLKNNKKYGWLIFDFPTKSLCKKVISTNF